MGVSDRRLRDGTSVDAIVIDDMVYLFTSRNQLFALDGATGQLIWQYKYPLPRGLVSYGPQNRVVAVGDGKVFMGTYDNYVVAIDQKTEDRFPECSMRIQKAAAPASATVWS